MNSPNLYRSIARDIRTNLALICKLRTNQSHIVISFFFPIFVSNYVMVVSFWLGIFTKNNRVIKKFKVSNFIEKSAKFYNVSNIDARYEGES